MENEKRIENNQLQVKKHSTLSILSFIFTLLGFTSAIGFVMACIDLLTYNKKCKHIFSWMSFAFGFLFMAIAIVFSYFIFIIGLSDSVSVEVESSTEYHATYEEPKGYYEEGEFFYTGDLKISINSADLNFSDYDDEYGWYTLEDGKKYISVSFTYENVGDSDAYVSIYDYKCYADGTLMEQTYYFNDDFINANISSGRNVSFETFYVVTTDAKEIELEYNELISLSDEKIIIKLQ